MNQEEEEDREEEEWEQRDAALALLAETVCNRRMHFIDTNLSHELGSERVSERSNKQT